MNYQSSLFFSNFYRLRRAIIDNKDEILQAISLDFSIKVEDAEIRELLPIMYDLDAMIKSPNFWAEQQIDLCAEDNYIGTRACVLNQPFGISLILGSADCELGAIIKPLVASIAAGNYTIIKPNINKHFIGKTEEVIHKILKKCLSNKRVLILENNDIDLVELVENKMVDFVYTSKECEESHRLSEACSKSGVPFKRHVNGWNAGIVDKKADIESAAVNLAINKFYKSGQHSDNLDVIYVNEEIYEDFLIAMKTSLFQFFQTTSLKGNLPYGKIRKPEDFSRLLGMLKIASHGGKFETSIVFDEKKMILNPVLIKNANLTSTVVNQKIGGPILPIQTYSKLTDIADSVNQHGHIENLYFFSNNKFSFETVGKTFKYQNLYLNCTNDPFPLNTFPDYGKHTTMNSSLNGEYSVNTFSKQKIYSRNLKLQKNFLTSKFFQ